MFEVKSRTIQAHVSGPESNVGSHVLTEKKVKGQTSRVIESIDWLLTCDSELVSLDFRLIDKRKSRYSLLC